MIKTHTQNNTDKLAILLIVVFLLFAQTATAQTTDTTVTPGDPLPTVGDSDSIPEGYSTEGLYSCEGGKYGSVGAERAQGVFVPVADQATITNTNILLYKQCILDGVVTRIRETMIAAMAKSTLSWAANQPAFEENPKKFRDDLKTKVTDDFISGPRTENICEPFKEDVKKTLKAQTDREVNNPEVSYSCSVPSEEQQAFKDFLNGKGRFNKDIYLKVISPENNPLLVYLGAADQLQKDKEEKIKDEFTLLGWGDGFKSKKEKKRIPKGNGEFEEVEQIVTPGAVVKDIISYTSLTGQRQLENADATGELIGSLMSNIHTQILTSVGGLKGLPDSINGGLSFLDRIVQDSAARARGQYTSIANDTLSKAIIAESEYNMARKASFDTINRTIQALQTKDAACWGGLVAQAKVDLLAELNTVNGTAISTPSTEEPPYGEDPLTDTQETTIDIDIVAAGGGNKAEATILRTTKYYLSVLTTDIVPLLATIKQNLEDSNAALTKLTDLQVRLSSATTPTETRAVLGEIDQLVASGTLHKTSDVLIAQDQQAQIQSSMSDLITETSSQWEASWCDPTKWRDQEKN